MLKKIIGFIVIASVLFGFYKLLSIPPKTENNQNEETALLAEKDKYIDYPIYDNPDIVLYWKVGCPYCENVEKWISENNINKVIKINYKEIHYIKSNQEDLVKTVQNNCPEQIGQQGIGVPLAFDVNNKICAAGDTPIIDFLKQKIK